MEYQEFICAVEKKINLELKGRIKTSLYTAVKNNGKVKKGVIMETPGINVSPTIYLEEFYQHFQEGESLDEIVGRIIEFYNMVKYDKPLDSSKIEYYDEIQDKIVFKLIHTKKNSEILKEIPHIEMLDLSIVFYILFDINRQGTATMTINNEHLCSWRVTKEVLFEKACKNVKRLLPAELFTMRQAVEDIMSPIPGKKKDLFQEKADSADDVMYVLSNSIRSFGAACIAYPDVLDMAGRILGEDYYVLPSSVHEVVLVPVSKGMEPEEMDAMVVEINDTQVAEEEILSDHVYIYERARKRLVHEKYVNY